MKMKKWAVLAACGALVASLALAGCSSGNAGNSGSGDKEAEGDASGYTLLTEGTLVVGTSPDYPPFENLVDGEIVGFEVDLMNAIAEDLGLTVEYKSMQFDTILPAVVAGGQIDVGMSGFSVTPERAEEIDFTETIYIDNQAVAVMKGGEVTADNAEEALNAAGVKIAVQSGTTGATWAQENFPNAEIVPYGNSTDCFAAMQAGNADAVCTNAAVVSSMLAEAYTDAEIVVTSATGEEYAFIVSQENPELTAAIDAAIVALTDDGTVDELTNKWFS